MALADYLNGNNGAKRVDGEPGFNEAAIQAIIQAITQEFDLDTLRSRDPAKRAQVRERMAVLAGPLVRDKFPGVGQRQLVALVDEAASRVMGWGFLDSLLPPARNDLVEIALTPNGVVWVKRKGAAFFEDTGLRPNVHEAFRVIDNILGPQGKALNEANPSVDAKLPRTEDNPGGGRVKALHPVIVPGQGWPSLSVRLFESHPVAPAQVLTWGVMTEEMMALLGLAVTRKLRVLIAGGTGTGKTTLLSALTNGFLPREARVVKIEDPEEIFLNRPHVVTLEARPAPPGSIVPPYTVADGVDDAMRMAPDWLIVGEMRTGNAALALFRAQMSDHPGLSTFHAEHPRAAVHRLAVIMFADAGVRMEAAKSLFKEAIDLYVQLGYDDNGTRRCMGIWQVERELKGGNVQFTPIFDAQGQKLNDVTRSRT